MTIPDWILPLALAVGGGTGLGALVNALVNAKSSTFEQLQVVTTTLQAERVADREKHAAERVADREKHAADRLEDREGAAEIRAKHEALDTKVDGLQTVITMYSDWSDTLLQWGRDGAPPPEPVRPIGLTGLI